MQPAETEVIAGSLSVGVPTPEQAAAQAEYERQKAEIRAGIEEIDAKVAALDTEKWNKRLTGSPTPNRAQRRAAEKRLRRQARNRRMK